MKLSVVILSLASLVFAASLRTFEQQPLPAAQSGFDLDLNAFRLIQLEGRAPEWVTEGRKAGHPPWSHVLTLVLTFLNRLN